MRLIKEVQNMLDVRTRYLLSIGSLLTLLLILGVAALHFNGIRF